MLWPSSTGNGTTPKSRMMCRTSDSAAAAVMRKLPVTVAAAGLSRLKRLMRGLDGRGRRARPAAGARMGIGQQRACFRIERIGHIPALLVDRRWRRQFRPAELVVERERIRHGEPVVDRAGRAWGDAVHAEIADRGIRRRSCWHRASPRRPGTWPRRCCTGCRSPGRSDAASAARRYRWCHPCCSVPCTRHARARPAPVVSQAGGRRVKPGDDGPFCRPHRYSWIFTYSKSPGLLSMPMPRRGDPAGEGAALPHRLHQAGDERCRRRSRAATRPPRAAHASAVSRLPSVIGVHGGELADAAVERDMRQRDAELDAGAARTRGSSAPTPAAASAT